MSYIIKKGYIGYVGTLEKYIKLFAKNNFNVRLSNDWAYSYSYPGDITVIRRNELLQYITVKNPKIKKDETIAKNIDLIKEKHTIVATLQEAYGQFYDILMGNNPDKLDTFIDKYKSSAICSFTEGIKKDITPVKNAISFPESNGFVEGNNNKFKLIKRILYGRANLVNLFKKCYVAFKTKSPNFSVSQLMQKTPL